MMGKSLKEDYRCQDKNGDEFYYRERVKSAVKGLLSKRVFKKCKGKLVNTELEEMYVFKKEDFEEAFEDVIKNA